MKVTEIKLIQHYLKEKSLYLEDIDGKRGEKTNAAIQNCLYSKLSLLDEGWQEWSSKRKAVACLQLLCSENDIEAGKIDGLYGPQTEAASNQLYLLKTTGVIPRGFGDISLIRENPHEFPLETHENLSRFYGDPCEVQLARVQCPWELRLDWDLSKTTRKISIHEKLSDSLSTILVSVYEHYGSEGIKEFGLDRYGGSYNCRKKRGSRSSWSTHAWGISIDWLPSKNKLKWDSDKASLAHPELDFWWETWEKEGWLSLGRTENRDWMHIQAAKR